MDWQAFRVSLSLGLWTVMLLVPVGMWAGHRLATRTFRGKALLEAAVAIPLLLPPTVLGFYLLTILSPRSAMGALFERLAGASLAFSFPGLVLASIIINLPFVVQPIQRAFEAIPADVRDAAACCGLSPWQRFLRIEAPLAWPGILTAAMLTFAHTLGEFGVVLMVGGNIPGRTRVISIAIYEQVETLNFAAAHVLSAGLLAFSFGVLVLAVTTLMMTTLLGKRLVARRG